MQYFNILPILSQVFFSLYMTLLLLSMLLKVKFIISLKVAFEID